MYERNGERKKMEKHFIIITQKNLNKYEKSRTIKKVEQKTIKKTNSCILLFSCTIQGNISVLTSYRIGFVKNETK